MSYVCADYQVYGYAIKDMAMTFYKRYYKKMILMEFYVLLPIVSFWDKVVYKVLNK